MEGKVAEIDWRSILTRNGIEYVEGGKSTAKNNIYVKCPLCGASDDGHHMGISVHSSGFRGWACWKKASHRGKSPVKLLMILLGISYQEASNMLGYDASMIEDQSLNGRVKQMFELAEPALRPRLKKLYWYDDIHRLKYKTSPEYPSTKVFQQYLIDRGYKSWQLSTLADNYRLHYSLTGPFRYRLIFPVYTEWGLTTWTGRVVVPDHEPRYMTLSTDPESRIGGALAPITDCLFNQKWLLKAWRASMLTKALILCEGPFDAMRMDYFGRNCGIHATCLFGKRISEAQIETLRFIGPRYKHKFLILDPDADMDSFELWDKIWKVGFNILRLDKRWKDPAEMDLAGFRKMTKGFL